VASPSLTLTVLGSGTAIPRFDRFPAGYLVQGGGHALLVDCGPGVLRRLAQTGVGLDALDGVCLTHFHPDHCADVAALLFALRNRAYHGRKPLQVWAAPGLCEWLALLTAAWPWLSARAADYALELRELDPGTTASARFESAPIP
jgi:ribonuclease BN (tRNA processing enzyme)